MATLLATAAVTLVFCAPGYPGATGDAQPYLDEFAKVVATTAGWPKESLNAVYDPTESGGLARLENPAAGLAFVPYPFFVAHEAQLRLVPLAQADVTGTGPRQRWKLIAQRGRIQSPAALTGFTLLSTAGYAPDFVTGAALAAWPLPPDVHIEATGQVLSALRRTAAGEPVVVLLDQSEAASLGGLPFAAQLATLAESPELPVALIAVVGSRVPAARAQSLKATLLNLGHDPANADMLAALRLQGFVPAAIPGRAPK